MKRFLLLLVTVLLMAAAPVCAAFAQPDQLNVEGARIMDTEPEYCPL